MKKKPQYMGTPMKKQRKEKTSRFLVWFISFCILITIGVIFFPQTADGEMDVPDWYNLLVGVIPILLAIFWRSPFISNLFKKIFGTFDRKTVETEDGEFEIPKSKKAQEALGARLIEEAKTNARLANESDDISLFITFYDDALDCLKKLCLLDKVSFKNDPKYNLLHLERETQWHLCDALASQKQRTLDEIKGKYRNSREFQEKQYEIFKSDIDDAKPRFSEKTHEFAQECLSEIEKFLGINQEPKHSSTPIAYSGIGGIDFMEGHQFEYWCADLLRKIGFSDVEVTQGSGDQGVDILAVKDGIKYAIQCKCYSSDLGNKPVQEVNTGKAIYHCQIGAVMTNRYFTQGGKEAADATGVLLWDRNWIRKRLEEIGE